MFFKEIVYIMVSFAMVTGIVALKGGKKEDRYEHKVAIAAIFQNEAPYLREWIEYHKLVGVTHFYLYNNRSDDNFLEVLAPYKDNEVELFDWNFQFTDGREDEWLYIQTGAYDDALSRARGVAKWVALLDIDEFLIPRNAASLPEFLQEFDEFGAVCVNWQTYGTSDIETLDPTKLLIQQLIRKSPSDHHDNLRVKSIVRPERVICTESAHHVLLRDGFKRVTTAQQPFDTFFSPTVLVDKAHINHYWTRDNAYFLNNKILRRTRWGYSMKTLVRRARDLNMVEDRCMDYYAERLTWIFKNTNER